MTLFDLLMVMGFISGGVIGFHLGYEFGLIVGVVGACLGVIIGFFIGRVPLVLALISVKRSFRKNTDEELLAMLHDPDYLAPNVVLLELKSRGHDVEKELPYVLNLLESDLQSKRICGWHALASAFPDYAELLSDYSVTGTPEECSRKIDKLRSKM